MPKSHKDYLEGTGVPVLLQQLLDAVCTDRPEDPLGYILELLKKWQAEGVAVAATPVAEKKGEVVKVETAAKEEPAAAVHEKTLELGASSPTVNSAERTGVNARCLPPPRASTLPPPYSSHWLHDCSSKHQPHCTALQA